MKMRNIGLVGLVCLSLLGGSAGCGVSNYQYTSFSKIEHVTDKDIIEISIDDRFNKEEESNIKGAVDEWNIVFNGQKELRLVKKCMVESCAKKFVDYVDRGSGIVILKLNGEDELISSVDTDGIIAFVPRKGAHLMIVIENHLGKKDLKGIVLHELGHIFGADHLEVEGSLMYPKYMRKQSDCVDKITAKMVSDYLELKFENMNYCIVPGL